ncbi:MAG TPA: RNA polymerase subunit sigma-24 [Micromonosporaceae bacterium]|nr:RNA polymerase subunit sigma-24 [Micromonosporaceae bacterium]
MVIRRTAVEDLLRDLAPQVLGLLVRRYDDFTDAEDALQEALLAAATQWPIQGVPANPRGWLITVATRRLADMWRSDEARRHRETRAAASEATTTTAEVSNQDDSLLLLFMCSHHALNPSSAIPLTLRAVGGLSTAEIARAFLVPEDTIAKRIARAKQRIKASSVPVREPAPDDLIERLPSVLHVLYLIFNEGYAASTGREVARAELSREAIRLTRMLHASLPGHPEVMGLLALMLLTDARRPARTGTTGELIPLSEQDRGLWDQKLIVEGQTLLYEALPQRAVGYYQVQAAIAAVHDEAATDAQTDWPQILALYGLLERMTSNPMVTLNRAIAAAMVHGPAAGLSLLSGLDTALAGHHRLDAVRAHLLEMAGDNEPAIENYRLAASRTTSLAERQYLTAKAAALGARRRAGLGRQT